ncbi:acyl-CoA dehydrogenase, partial [Nocardioides sp. GCM10030258]
MIDFEIPADLAARRDEVLAFVTEKVVPFEKDPRVTPHGPTESLRNELVALAREAGLLTFQAPRDGRAAPTHIEQAILFEAAGWSFLGPVALNCAAPDEGNMFLLDKIANAEQAMQFLRPVVEGRQRSVFAMTEPDGAGSDPRQLATTA